jgi:protein-L-isoaspartate(D-aspartate) O-methyltransferase
MNLNKAVSLVSPDYYMLQNNGDLLTQTTKPQAIENALSMLDLQGGQKILEIGTGSGYSTALLATLVGKTGNVLSIDIDPTLTQRAQKKLIDYPWVQCITDDGRKGHSPTAPFDRIIAWTSPDSFPSSWMEQIKEEGIIVAPFRVLDIVQCTVMTRFKKVDQVLQGDFVQPEGYIPMTSQAVIDFDQFGPESQSDLVGVGKEPFWAGAHWMKTTNTKDKWIEKFLQANPEISPFQEKGQDIRAYLLGIQADGFTFAFRPNDGDWIGYSTAHGFALVSFRQPNKWIISDSKHAGVLHEWWKNWESLGKPSYEQLLPVLKNGKVKVRLKDALSQ